MSESAVARKQSGNRILVSFEGALTIGNAAVRIEDGRWIRLGILDVVYER